MRTSGVSAVPAPAERESQAATRRPKRRTAAVVVGLLVAALSPFVASAADDTPRPPTQDPAMPIVGSLPLGFNPGQSNMWIDPALHIGAINANGALNLYDLAGLHALAPINMEIQDTNWLTSVAVDDGTVSGKHRQFWVHLVNNVAAPQCPPETAIHVLNLETRSDGSFDHAEWGAPVPVPCYDAGAQSPVADPTKDKSLSAAPVDGFGVDGVAYYARPAASGAPPAEKLLVMGASATEARVQGLGNAFTKFAHESTIVQELDARTGERDFEVDVSNVCDFHQNNGKSGWITRSGDHVVLYCTKNGDSQGELVDIPLVRGDLKDGLTYVNGSPVINSMNTIKADRVDLDPGTGVALLTAKVLPYGPAVWGYDALNQRFLGQVPTGFAPIGNDSRFYSGADQLSGRLYLHTSQGFVVVDGRHNPLPGGQPYGTLTGTLPLDAATTTIPMPVDGGLRRIFVPDFDHSAYTVVQDDTPRVPDPCLGKPLPCPDPDSQTADMAEDPPHTDNNFTSAANAYGVHLLNASGPGAFVQNFGGTTGNAEGGVDCSAVPGVCLTSVAFAPGTREGFLAQTSVGEAKTAGASAFASAARAAPRYPTDATNDDVKELGRCDFDRLDKAARTEVPPDPFFQRDQVWGQVNTLWTTLMGKGNKPGLYETGMLAAGEKDASPVDLCSVPPRVPPQAEAGVMALGPVMQAIDQTGLSQLYPQNLQKGAARDDGSEWPANGTLCANFAGVPPPPSTVSHDPQTPVGNIVGYATAACDATKHVSTAQAEFAGPGLPGVPSPSISVAHATSQLDTRITSEGAVTTATSTASGIEIAGVVSIGRVVTTVTTKAHGIHGSSLADFQRHLYDVHGPGIDCMTTSDDENGKEPCTGKNVVAGLNRALGAGRIELSLPSPDAKATAHGYQGVVQKPPSVQDGDRILNDDGTVTVDGLDILVVNDSGYGDVFNGDADRHGGTSRLLVGLAGVQAESHFGVFPATLFDNSGGGSTGGTPPTPPTPATPDIPGSAGSSFDIPGTSTPGQHIPGTGPMSLASSKGKVHHKPNLLHRFLHALGHPLEALKKFWSLIISHPMEALLVFLLLGMFGIPLYLGLRRRKMAQAMAA